MKKILIMFVLLLLTGCTKSVPVVPAVEAPVVDNSVATDSFEPRVYKGEGFQFTYMGSTQDLSNAGDTGLVPEEVIHLHPWQSISVLFAAADDKDLATKIAPFQTADGQRGTLTKVTSDSGVIFGMSAGQDSAAGKVYYLYRYITKKQDNSYIILEFVHMHCASCLDEKGNPLVFNEAVDAQWITDVVKSFHYTKE